MKGTLKITAALLLIAVLILAAGCSKQQKLSTVNLSISAAASMQNSLDEVKQLYKSVKPNVTLTFNYGASGTLQQQIEQGADVDIFISAAPKQMNTLEKENLILNDTRKNFLENDVVLIAPKDNSSITGFSDLTTDKVKRIAMGEPKSVPAGQYAEEVFTKLGILNKIKTKIVYGSNVEQVLSWVETGNADAGIVYSTDAKSSGNVRVVATAPSDTHDPVIYPAAVIKSSKNTAAARDFLNFLTSDKAKTVFEKYGFKVSIK